MLIARCCIATFVQESNSDLRAGVAMTLKT
jgi:hypothetical protein